MRVAVYRNLHKGCFSVQHRGRVIAHVAEIALEDVEFRVSQAGRARVLREGRKNVHAKVWGTIADFRDDEIGDLVEIYYNPYQVETFVIGDRPVFTSDYCILRDNAVWVEDSR